MTRRQAVALFCCSLLGFLSVFGCSGGGGGGGGSTPQPPPPTVTLQGRVDDGLQHSPIANATCRFTDLQGTPLATATADGSGTFQLVVPLNVQGFLHCTPPSLSHLEMSTFVSTVGRTAGQAIANLTVDPRTTLVAAVLTNTHPPDPQARAAELIALLLAADPDLSLLAQASTDLYTAQLATRIDVTFSSGSENEGGPDGGGSDGGASDGGGTGGDTGDGGAFSPLPGAACDFALTMDGPVLRNVTLADLLANGAVVRPDLQAIASPVNAALAGQQAAIIAAFNRLFPTGLGRPIATTTDTNGAYFLSTPPGVRGFVRCNPADAANLALSRFVPARQTGEKLMGQTVTPATTVAAMVVTDALQAGLDPIPIQHAFLADIAPLQIILPDHPNGNGMFATVQLLPGTTLTNPNAALLAFAATTIFDTMRLQRAAIPTTVTFAAAVQDYFQDATFTPQLAPLTQGVNTALDQGQPVITLGSNDIPLADSTGTIVGTVTDLNGTPLAGAQVATQQGTVVQMAQTDASGHFTLANVPPGATTVTATLGSFSTRRPLTVIAGGTVMLTVTLGSPCTAVTVAPPTARLGIGQTQQFTATVQGTGTCSSAVTWLVNNVPGGNATLGTISATGLYTAPSPVLSPITVTITAVSDADPALSGAAQVTVIPVSPLPCSVTVAPPTASVIVGQTQQFTATVQGTGTCSSAVTWLVNNVPGGNATLGTISATGLYTAPATVPSLNPVTVSAISGADSTLSGSAQVTVTPVPPSIMAVTVAPRTTNVIVGQTQSFSATVQGTGTFSSAVIWLVNNVPEGNATLGTISATGLYTAPATVPSSNPVMVTAISVADSTKSDSAQVTVQGPPVVTSPGNQSTLEDQTVALQIVAVDPNRNSLTCSASGLPPNLSINAATCLISGTISFTAVSHPARQRDFSVTVTASADTRSGSTTFTWTVIDVDQPPVANAGPAQTVFVQQTVTLDGRASSDPDGDPLTFQWSFVTRPTGSRATLSNSTASQPTFVPDLPGTYMVQLLVNDGAVNSTPSTVTITANLLSPRFAYVTNVFDGTVSMYIVDATTGQLRHNGYVAAGMQPESVTVDPFGRFAYVANAVSNTISGYTISASSGALTPIPGSPFAAGTTPLSVTVDPSGRFAYVANDISNTISGYTINASSGALTPIPGSPFAAGTNPFSVTVDPSGRFAYEGNSGSSTISGYTIDASSGALTPIPGSPFAAGSSPVSVTVDPSGRFAYVTNENSNTISGYTIDASTGALTPIPGSPFATGTDPRSVTVDPSGRFAYVANDTSNTISGYTIDASSGALTPIPGSPFAAGTSPNEVTVDPSGQFVYVTNPNSDEVSVYTISAATGALTAVGTVRTRVAPTSIALTRGTAPVTITPRFAYVANNSSNNISGYTIDATTSVLTPIAGSPFPAGTSPNSVTVDPSGRFAYVTNNGSANVSAYTLNTTTGVLTPIAGSPFPAGTSPNSVTVDPSGRFAYVANGSSNNISGYTISASSGALTPIPGSPFPAGTSPNSVTVDPSGRFAYVANGGSNISGYTIDATTGVLTPVTGSPFPAGFVPISVTVDPSGRFVYVANGTLTSGDVSAYTINFANGALTPIVGSPFPAGTFPQTVTVDPSGRFVYVANETSNTISGYTLNATTGVLTPIPGSPFSAGQGPHSVTVDPSHRFAYVANLGGNVSGYTLNATTGVLTPIPGSPFSAGQGPFSVITTGTIQ